ncbi:hypothetical protein [Salipiger mucosus]|nr:hypothetical protein [Salipiger mucosus]
MRLPAEPAEVLDIPESDIPEVVGALVAEKRLSTLMSAIHANLWSDDPALRQQGTAALRRLGFPD